MNLRFAGGFASGNGCPWGAAAILWGILWLLPVALSADGTSAVGALAQPAPLVLDVTKAPFYAVGNGLVNDRLAIQAAIDTAGAWPTGGEVRLKAGRTFLTGTLELKSNVSLRIPSGSVLLSSRNPDDYPHAVEFGRRFEGSPYVWDDKYLWNYPLIYAAPGTSRIKVFGYGAIKIGGLPGAGDDEQLFLSAIGFFQVSDFELANFKIRGSKGYNVQLHQCSRGFIHNLDIAAPYTGSDFNCDGISMEGCQNLRVNRCRVETNDDLIYCWSSWRDPRGRTWWNSENPQPTRNILVENNWCRLIRNGGARGFLILAWGGAAPDPESVAISNVVVRNNTFKAPYPIAVLTGDPFYGGNQPPLRAITFRNNRLYSYHHNPRIILGGASFEALLVTQNLYFYLP